MNQEIDTQRIMSQINEFLRNRQTSSKNLSADVSTEYRGMAGDDDLQVSLTLDSKGNMKSLDISNALKGLCGGEPDVYFAVLTDLIIAAHNNAKSQMYEDAANLGTRCNSDDIQR